MTSTVEPRPVVVGVDGTAAGLRAVTWAVQEARARHLPLEIVHAAPYAERGTWRRRATGILGRAHASARALDPDLCVRTRRLDRLPVPALLSAAEDAELLVLGVLGSGHPQDVLSNPVLATVVGRAPVQVAVVHQGSPAPDGPVVLGIGDLDTDVALLPVAHACAHRYGTSLHVVHAGRHGSPVVADRDVLAELVRQWDDRTSTVRVRLETPDERPMPALLGRAHAARLLVVGASVRRVHVLLGSTARAAVFGSECPVLVVPHPEPVARPDTPADLGADPHAPGRVVVTTGPAEPTLTVRDEGPPDAVLRPRGTGDDRGRR